MAKGMRASGRTTMEAGSKYGSRRREQYQEDEDENLELLTEPDADEEDEDADVDIYGADDDLDDDPDSFDLDGDSDDEGLDDIDTTDISDDEMSINGQSLEDDEDDEDEDEDGETQNLDAVVSQLRDILSSLENMDGEDEDNEDEDEDDDDDDDDDVDDLDDEDFDDEDEDEDEDEDDDKKMTEAAKICIGLKARVKDVAEGDTTSYEIVMSPVKGPAGKNKLTPSSPLGKAICNYYRKNGTSVPKGGAKIMNGKKLIMSLDDKSIKESTSPNKLKAPKGQDGKIQSKAQIDPSKYSSSHGRAKALPKTGKVTGQEGAIDLKTIFDEIEKASENAVKKIGGDPHQVGGQVKAAISAARDIATKHTNLVKQMYKGGNAGLPESFKKDIATSLDYDMTDEVNELYSGSDLSEEFKSSAKRMFERAVKARVLEALDEVDTLFGLALAEESKRLESSLVDKVDEYFDYVTENFFEDNKIAIEEGVHREINDSFMDGLRDLFESHYIEVPKGKENLIEKLQSEIAEKEDLLAKTRRKAVGYRKEARELRKQNIITELSNDLSMSQAAKLKEAASDFEFSGDDAEFASRVRRLKESYFGKKKISKPEHEFETLAEELSNVGSSNMDAYIAAIKKTTDKK